MFEAKMQRAAAQFDEIQEAIQSKKATIDQIAKDANEQIAKVNDEIKFLTEESTRLQGEHRVLKELMAESIATETTTVDGIPELEPVEEPGEEPVPDQAE